MIKHRKSWLSIIGIICLAISGQGFALQADQKEKIYISSDYAEMNRQTGIGIYRSGVEIDMGTTHVTGDILTTHMNKQNKIEVAVVEGNKKQLAHYRTIPEEGKAELHAKSKIIKFYPQRKYVILIGNASITQGHDSITGERLEYDMNKQSLISPKVAGAKKSRTRIVIDPNGDSGIKSMTTLASNE